MEYLLNINSRKIHNLRSADKRCRIHLMQASNKLIFDSYDDAKNYLPKGNKSACPCAFCLGPDFEKKMEGKNEK